VPTRAPARVGRPLDQARSCGGETRFRWRKGSRL